MTAAGNKLHGVSIKYPHPSHVVVPDDIPVSTSGLHGCGLCAGLLGVAATPQSAGEICDHQQLIHWKDRVPYGKTGLSVVVCRLQCVGPDTEAAGHYHCPDCSVCYTDKEHFSQHITAELKNLGNLEHKEETDAPFIQTAGSDSDAAVIHIESKSTLLNPGVQHEGLGNNSGDQELANTAEILPVTSEVIEYQIESSSSLGEVPSYVEYHIQTEEPNQALEMGAKSEVIMWEVSGDIDTNNTIVYYTECQQDTSAEESQPGQQCTVQEETAGMLPVEPTEESNQMKEIENIAVSTNIRNVEGQTLLMNSAPKQLVCDHDNQKSEREIFSKDQSTENLFEEKKDTIEIDTNQIDEAHASAAEGLLNSVDAQSIAALDSGNHGNEAHSSTCLTTADEDLIDVKPVTSADQTAQNQQERMDGPHDPERKTDSISISESLLGTQNLVPDEKETCPTEQACATDAVKGDPDLAPVSREEFKKLAKESSLKFDDVKKFAGKNWHVTMVSSLYDLPASQCTDVCCQGRDLYHCQLCPQQSPGAMTWNRLQQHLISQHWRPRISHKDLSILPCRLGCVYGINDRSTLYPCFGHWHCPLCQRLLRDRVKLDKHLHAHQMGSSQFLRHTHRTIWPLPKFVNPKLPSKPPATDNGKECSVESEAVDTLVEEEETEAHETTQEPEPGKPRPHAVFQTVAGLLLPELIQAIPGDPAAFLHHLEAVTGIKSNLSGPDLCTLQGEWAALGRAYRMLESFRLAPPEEDWQQMLMSEPLTRDASTNTEPHPVQNVESAAGQPRKRGRPKGSYKRAAPGDITEASTATETLPTKRVRQCSTEGLKSGSGIQDAQGPGTQLPASSDTATQSASQVAPQYRIKKCSVNLQRYSPDEGLVKLEAAEEGEGKLVIDDSVKSGEVTRKKKGRGRPPKLHKNVASSCNQVAAEITDTSTNLKRGRGRPVKQPVTRNEPCVQNEDSTPVRKSSRKRPPHLFLDRDKPQVASQVQITPVKVHKFEGSGRPKSSSSSERQCSSRPHPSVITDTKDQSEPEAGSLEAKLGRDHHEATQSTSGTHQSDHQSNIQSSQPPNEDKLLHADSSCSVIESPENVDKRNKNQINSDFPGKHKNDFASKSTRPAAVGKSPDPKSLGHLANIETDAKVKECLISAEQKFHSINSKGEKCSESSALECQTLIVKTEDSPAERGESLTPVASETTGDVPLHTVPTPKEAVKEAHFNVQQRGEGFQLSLVVPRKSSSLELQDNEQENTDTVQQDMNEDKKDVELIPQPLLVFEPAEYSLHPPDGRVVTDEAQSATRAVPADSEHVVELPVGLDGEEAEGPDSESDVNTEGEVVQIKEETDVPLDWQATQCTVCYKPFRNLKQFYTHLLQVSCGLPANYSKLPEGLGTKLDDARAQVQKPKCPLCSADFKGIAPARAHFLCRLCERTRMPAKVRLHTEGLRYCTESKLYECPLCKFKAKTYHKTALHHYRVHAEKTIKCPQCERLYGHDILLQKHIKLTHQSGPTALSICDYCGAEMKASYLKQHINTKHNPNYKPTSRRRDEEIFCPVEGCKYRTHYASEMYRHRRRAHEPHTKICEDCGKTFALQMDLNRHRRDHHDEAGASRVNCPQCSKPILNRNLPHHIRTVHEGVRRYMCKICGKSFHTAHVLSCHEDTHKAPQDRITKYLCPHCGKGFRNRTLYTDHLNIHTGARPYSCGECGKTFRLKVVLRRHEEMHRSSQHPCDVCGMVFNSVRNLYQHRRRHRDASTYSCLCGAIYQNFKSLRIHRQECEAWLMRKEGHQSEAAMATVEETMLLLQGNTVLQQDGQTMLVVETPEGGTAEEILNIITPQQMSAPQVEYEMSGESVEMEGSSEAANMEGQNQYLCGYCQTLFVTFDEAQAHMMEEHIQELPTGEEEEALVGPAEGTAQSGETDQQDTVTGSQLMEGQGSTE